jgi:hypothetical protein
VINNKLEGKNIHGLNLITCTFQLIDDRVDKLASCSSWKRPFTVIHIIIIIIIIIKVLKLWNVFECANFESGQS